MRRLVPVLIAIGLLGPPVGAVSFYFTPDVPTDDPSGATTTIFLPWDVVRYDPGGYSLKLTLPSGTAIDGLHQLCNGDWLLSFESSATLGATTYDPRDVVRYDPVAGTYSLFFGGAGAGVPVGSDVDGLFLVAGDASALVVSFDVPTTIGAATYEPADLVRYSGGTFSLYFDGSAATPPIPSAVNVTGSDRRGNLRILTFDVPATLGAATYLPGELVSWDGTTFASFWADPGWPLSSRLDAWTFLPDPGEVPTIRVNKSMLVPGNLSISWAASSSAGAEDYGIYEGRMGLWYSHTAIDCSDSGADRVEEVMPGAGNRYYVVVALNPDLEGSYGRDSSGIERPQGSPGACRAAQGFDCP
jgi:hypothetical protein